MSNYFPRRGGDSYRMLDLHNSNSNRFSGYSSRSSNNTYDELVNGVKRKKRNHKRPGQNSGSGFNPAFKEPNKPPQSSYSTGSPRANPFYKSAPRLPPPPLHAFEMNEMPDFVERQHRGSDWEWQSFFQQSKNWQDKHKLAYYRSRCMALEFENKMLFEQIASLIDENTIFAKERGEVPTIKLPHIPAFDGQEPKTTKPNKSAETTNKKAPQGKNNEVQNRTKSKTDLEFEISEEMMSFLEKSMRHKLSMRLKNQQGKSSEEMEVDIEIKQEIKKEDMNAEVKSQRPREPPGLKYQEELDLLYGSSSALIRGLETSIKLNFNRNCDLHKPELWMAVPLNRETISS